MAKIPIGGSTLRSDMRQSPEDGGFSVGQKNKAIRSVGFPNGLN